MAEQTPSNLPSEAVIDAVSVKAFQFIKAVSNNLGIRAALAKKGYNAKIHRAAWDAVIKAAGFGKNLDAVLAKPEAAAAQAELDAWDEPNFEMVHGILAPMPEQQAYVFNNLAAQKGPASVGGVELFLKRLDELESGKGRTKAQHKQDLEAIEKLAERGYDKDERTRLANLVEVAKGFEDATVVQAGPTEAEKKEQRDAKIAVYYYFNEWSTIAKRVITRRDYLIQLGLAKRKKAPKGKGGGDQAGAAEQPGDASDGAAAGNK